MAKAATTDNVNKSRQAPDARFAVQTIRGSIEKRKSFISTKNGEIADDWKKIEARGINKTGARIWNILDKLSEEERVDAWRTLDAMADVSEWPEQAEDLVDAAEGKVIQLRHGKGADDTTDAELEELEEGEGGEPVEETEAELDELEDDAAKPKLKPVSFGNGTVAGATHEVAGDNDQAQRDAEFENAAPKGAGKTKPKHDPIV